MGLFKSTFQRAAETAEVTSPENYLAKGGTFSQYLASIAFYLTPVDSRPLPDQNLHKAEKKLPLARKYAAQLPLDTETIQDLTAELERSYDFLKLHSESRKGHLTSRASEQLKSSRSHLDQAIGLIGEAGE